MLRIKNISNSTVSVDLTPDPSRVFRPTLSAGQSADIPSSILRAEVAVNADVNRLVAAGLIEIQEIADTSEALPEESFDDPVVMSSTLDVADVATFDDDVDVAGDATVDGTLEVTAGLMVGTSVLPGGYSARFSTNPVELFSDSAGATGLPLEFYLDSATPAGAVGATPGDQVGVIKAFGNDSLDNKTEYARIEMESEVVTDGSERGRLRVRLADGLGTGVKDVGGWTVSGFSNKGNLGAGFGPELSATLDTGSGAAGVGANGNDAGYLSFYGPDSSGANTLWAYLTGKIVTATNGVTETGSLLVNVRHNGADVTAVTFDGAGVKLPSGRGYYVNSIQVLGAQGAAVADAAGGATVDAEARTAINTLLARLRAHGIIAT